MFKDDPLNIVISLDYILIFTRNMWIIGMSLDFDIYKKYVSFWKVQTIKVP